MKVLTDEAAREWLQKRDICLSDAGRLSFGDKKPAVSPLAAPRTRERVVSLPTNLVGILDSDMEWLLWLRDFDIWSTETEEIGWELIDALSRGEDQPKLALNSRAFLFAPNEKVLLKAALVVPLMFRWDAYLVNGDGETFVTIDHDDHNSISTTSAKVTQAIEGSQLDPGS